MTDPASQPKHSLPEAEVDHQRGESDALSGMRHSLRTPLNQIIGYCEMLQEELQDEQVDASLFADLGKIHTAGGQLLALINEGLAPWKLETGRVDLDGMRLEMRTPLNLIIGYGEMCEEVATDFGNQRLVADLQKIGAAAHNLLALFNSSSFPTQLDIGVRAARAGDAAAATLGPNVSGQKARSGIQEGTGRILIVDDNEMNRNMLSRRLERHGYKTSEAENGREAVEHLTKESFDLVLLDVLMPELNGFETLQLIKAEKRTQHIPVIMISAMDELDAAVRCIEIGAEDYVPKPFNPILLNARITASLEKKRLRDHEMSIMMQLRVEREKTDRLLYSILPKVVADRMKAGDTNVADTFEAATVLYADIVDFAELTEKYPATKMVQYLNDIFSGFDWLMETQGLERIRTMGGVYMAVAGVPTPRADHLEVTAEIALEMLRVTNRFNMRSGVDFKIRIGMCSGPLTAGIVGRKKFLYHVWGDTSVVARDLESSCAPGCVQVTEAIRDKLKDKYVFKESGNVSSRGRSKIAAYHLTGRLVKQP